MALAHSKRPLYGIQFHPESVATLFGERLLANFRDLTAAFRGSGMPGVQPCSTLSSHVICLAVPPALGLTLRTGIERWQVKAQAGESVIRCVGAVSWHVITSKLYQLSKEGQLCCSAELHCKFGDTI